MIVDDWDALLCFEYFWTIISHFSQSRQVRREKKGRPNNFYCGNKNVGEERDSLTQYMTYIIQYHNDVNQP